MKFLVVIPVINEVVTDNCINSIDKKYHDNILLIDNSPNGFASKYNIKYEHHPENLGVGRSWNVGARKVLDEKLDYLVIMSATIIFTDGMNDLIDKLENNQNGYGLESQHVWHLICLSYETLLTVGLFDENFYPGYYEDSDYIRRMELCGIHMPMEKSPRIPKIDIKAVHQGDAHAMKSGIKVNMEACRQYFIEKWGSEPRYNSQSDRDVLYRDPFNNHNNSIDFFENKTIDELKSEYGL